MKNEIDRNELYKKQVSTLKKSSIMFGDYTFVPKDFICYFCKKDILEDEKTLDNVIKGILITGCPFCHKSYYIGNIFSP